MAGALFDECLACDPNSYFFSAGQRWVRSPISRCRRPNPPTVNTLQISLFWTLNPRCLS